MATIAERIKEALNLRGMKQADLVEKTKIGKSSISTYISGEYEPKLTNIIKIADALDVNVSWLTGHDIPMDKIKVPIEDIKMQISRKNLNLIIEKTRAIISKFLSVTFAEEEVKKIEEIIDNAFKNNFQNILKKDVCLDENIQLPKLEVVDDKNELLILNNYRELNSIGKSEALKRIEELTYVYKYKSKVPKYTQPIEAAQNDINDK